MLGAEAAVAVEAEFGALVQGDALRDLWQLKLEQMLSVGSHLNGQTTHAQELALQTDQEMQNESVTMRDCDTRS